MAQRIPSAGDRIRPLGQAAQGVEDEAEVLDEIVGAGLDGRDAA